MTVELHHRHFGQPGRPPLLLLHGLLGSSRNWQAVGRDIGEHHHVAALDLRNHGRSPHGDPMDYATMAADVLAWMDRHAWRRGVLAGHSMGGKVAMRLACDHPGRVERLIVVDIAPKDYLCRGHRTEFAAMLEIPVDLLRSRREAEMMMETRVPDEGMRRFLTTNLEETDGGGWKWAINLQGIASALPVLEGNSLGDNDRYVGPVHFIVGGRSSYVQPGDWSRILTHFPMARLTVLPDSGHSPHVESRAAFVGALLDTS